MYNSTSHEENTNLPAFNLEWIRAKIAYLGIFLASLDLKSYFGKRKYRLFGFHPRMEM